MRRWDEVNIGDFSGPLDLLLSMVKDKKINIIDVNLIELSNQYIEYINLQKSLDIEIASEYLVMAAQLIELKSKTLLPVEAEFEDDGYSYEGFLEQLTKYEQIRSVTDFFIEKQNEYLTTFSKRKSKTRFAALVADKESEGMINPLNMDMESFAEIFKKIMLEVELRNYEDLNVFEEEYSTITNEVISPQEIADMIIEKMQVNTVKTWMLKELLDDNTFNIKNLISTFLAILDLVRHQIIRVAQKGDELEVGFTQAVIEDQSLIKKIEVEGYE